MWNEDCPYKVVRTNGSDEVLARAANLLIGRAAFETAGRMYPKDGLRRRLEGQRSGRERQPGRSLGGGGDGGQERPGRKGRAPSGRVILRRAGTRKGSKAVVLSDEDSSSELSRTRAPGPLFRVDSDAAKLRHFEREKSRRSTSISRLFLVGKTLAAGELLVSY